MSTSSPAESLIVYPCDFPIKVMGLARDDFLPTMAGIARGFDPAFDAKTIEVRPSSGGRYVGLTLTVRVQSRAQLDDLYRALHGHAMVSVVL